MPFIRIVILSYNSSLHTLNILASLNKQSHKESEIIIVDNASKKEEAELLRKNVPHHIETIFSHQNLGYSFGNNLGMKHVTINSPDYFLILNNDVIIEDENFIEKLVKTFDHSIKKPIIAVSPLVNTISLNIPLENQIQVRRLLPSIQLFIVCSAILKPFSKKIFENYVYKKEMPYKNKLLECDTINGAAFMIKADYMRMVNFLDDGTFLFFEEIILGQQIKNKGGICFLNGNVSLKHLQGASTGSSKAKLNIAMERHKYASEIYFFRKYRGLNSSIIFIYKVLKELEILIKRILVKW